ncbi:MAG: hypothetical protein R3C59_01990 [Planctomycetaceae bacterium]
MISGTQTLFNWSLRSDSRSVYPHIVRAAFAGFMLLSILGAWGASLSGMAPGLKFFEGICSLNVLLISVAGISYFVSAVTEEKDSGTLALLRLAGVSPLAIVLSKSTSRLISSLMLLLIQLPFTFLAITLGGVTWQQIIAAYLALAAWLCLVANMALFCSVRCTSSGRAAGMATSALLMFFAAGPLLQQFATLKAGSWITPGMLTACASLYAEVQQTTVTTRLEEIFATTTVVQLAGTQLWRSLMIGGTLFVLSVVMFNRYSEPVEDNTHGQSAAVRRFTVGRCWRWPIVWKDFLFFTGGRTFLSMKLAGYALLVGGFVWFHQLERPTADAWLSPDLVRTAFLTIALLLTIEILLYSSNSLFLEVRQSAVASLKMLPIQTPVLLLQKAGACGVALIPAALCLLLLWAYDPQSITSLHHSQRAGLTRNVFDAVFRDLPGAIIGWLIVVMLMTHLTILLSLYTRWAALPLAVFLTAISFPCIGAAALGLTKVTEEAAALNGISWGVWFGVIVNLVWLWLFVLLPIEIEIVNRWNRLSRE